MSHKLVMVTRLMHGSLIMAAIVALFTNFCPESMQLPVWICYAIAIPVITTYLAAEYIPHMVAYLFYCVALSMLVWAVFPNRYYQYLFGIATVLICLIYFVSRVQDKQSWLLQPHYLTLIVFFIFYIIGLYMEREEIREFIYQAAFLYLIFYAVHLNQKNLGHYIEMNQDTARFPFRQMRRVNTVMLLLFVGVLMLAMYLLPSLGLDQLLLQLGDLLLSLLRSLVGRFAQDSLPQNNFLPLETEAAEEATQSGLVQAQPHPQWLDLVTNLLTGFIIVAAIIGVLGGVLYGTYRLYKAFDHTNAENGEHREYLPTKTEAQWIFLDEGNGLWKKKKRLWMDFSMTAAIRKLWIKGLRAHHREGIVSHLTPQELHTATEWESSEAHALYEKARYSQEEIKREEVEQMKQVVRERSRKNNL